MSEARGFKNKIKSLLFVLIFVGLVATSIISGVSLWVTKNLTQSIEALGNNSKVLAEGNLAISNTIANYLDRQGRITSAKTLEQLAEFEDRSILEEDFEHQYVTLNNNLQVTSGSKEAQSLRSAFGKFNQLDDELLTLKKEILQLETSVKSRSVDVAAVFDRTRTYANSLANKIRVYEKEKNKERNDAIALEKQQESATLEKQEQEKQKQQQKEEKNLFDMFWLFSSDKQQKPQATDNTSNIAQLEQFAIIRKQERASIKKETDRISMALVDKNTEGNETKSLISLHISNLERATQKLRLSKDNQLLTDIRESKIIPELNKLNSKLKKIRNINIPIEDYEKIIVAIIDDVKELSHQLTEQKDSLFANKYDLILQSDRFSALKKQLNQARSELLMNLEQLSQSGDLLAFRTKSNAAIVVSKSREYIISIGIAVLIIFLIFGYIIAKNINRMANKIKQQSDEMKKANQAITKAHAELQESNELITESLGYASKIQRAIQSSEQEFECFCDDSFVIWQPRDIVGGDMYLVRSWGEGKLILVVDCTGHGVPGAFMTILTKSALDKSLQFVQPGETGKLLSTMHQIIQSDLGQDGDDSIADDGLDLGACYVSNRKNQLIFSGARLSLIYHTSTRLKELRGDKISIGYRGIKPVISFTEHKLELKHRTNYYMFTDGIIDQIGGDRTLSFGRRRLFKIIDEISDQTMGEQAIVINKELAKYQGTQNRRDDVTIIGFTLTIENKTQQINSNSQLITNR